MSKWNELCQSYGESRTEFFDYRDRCVRVLSAWVTAMRTQWEMPTEQLTFRPLQGEIKENSTYTLFGAVHLDEDTFWHLGVVLTVYQAPNTFPHASMLLRLKVREMPKGGFLLKLADLKGEFEVSGPEDNFTPACDHVFGTIKSHFQEGLKTFLEGEQTVRIGFGAS